MDIVKSTKIWDGLNEKVSLREDFQLSKQETEKNINNSKLKKPL